MATPFSQFTWRHGLIGLMSVAAIAATTLHGPIAQEASYHQFADQRTLLGVPHLWNVLSNLPFVLVGALGLRSVWAGHSAGVLPPLRAAYLVFFVASALIGVGSAYYHLQPNNETLVWDRLPMTLAFMAFFCAVVGEHIHVRLGQRALLPLLIAGVCSVLWWKVSGDLRLYVLMQFLPIALTPLILLLFASRLSSVGYLWAVLGAYVLAKALEFLDAPIYEALGISGHSFKHVVAAGGVYIVWLAVAHRKERTS